MWYAHLDVEQALDEFERDLHGKTGRTVRRAVEKARQKDNQRAADKLAHRVGDALRFNSQPPELVPLSDLEALQGYTDSNELFAALQELLDSYLASLPYDRRMLLEHYHVHDAARKVVGVGSVGTRAWIALLAGKNADDPLILQAKEASELGWTKATAPDGTARDYYVRQLWNGKGSIDLERIGAGSLESVARLCAHALAHAHARTGDELAISAYLDDGDAFEDALWNFSQAYADQNEADYEVFMARHGTRA